MTRFSIHHIPLPVRLMRELARVVRPGGKIIVVDHLADDDADARSWSQEIERLRDPSHWACLGPGQMRAIGERAGLSLEGEQRFAYELDFDDWLGRGTSSSQAQALVNDAIGARRRQLNASKSPATGAIGPSRCRSGWASGGVLDLATAEQPSRPHASPFAIAPSREVRNVAGVATVLMLPLSSGGDPEQKSERQALWSARSLCIRETRGATSAASTSKRELVSGSVVLPWPQNCRLCSSVPPTIRSSTLRAGERE